MLSHHGVLVHCQGLEAGPTFGRAQVAEGDGDVTKETAAFGAFDRTSSEALTKLLDAQAGELREVWSKEPFAGFESRGAAVTALAVPGTDILADVAAEDVATETLPKRLWDGAALLDRQVADAASGVEDERLGQGTGGAGVETGAAASAEVSPWSVRGKIEIGDEFAEEEEGPVLGVEEARVLAPGAEARGVRPGLLGDGPRVDVPARRERSGHLGDPNGETVE